jgi:hypothetical protein
MCFDDIAAVGTGVHSSSLGGGSSSLSEFDVFWVLADLGQLQPFVVRTNFGPHSFISSHLEGQVVFLADLHSL